MPPCSHELDHVGTQNLERRGTPSYHATRSARQDNHVRQVPSLPHQHETVIIQGAGQASGRCCKRGTPSMSPAALFFCFVSCALVGIICRRSQITVTRKKVK